MGNKRILASSSGTAKKGREKDEKMIPDTSIFDLIPRFVPGHLGCHYQLLLDSRKAASSVSCLLDIKPAGRKRDIKVISVHGVGEFLCILDRLRSDKSQKGYIH
ncbi:hypothetical protein TNCT_131581 [Trichonephila clavata]|uniref:Uncharacterized protein n=1 Tax=Trichonephila clavata TaxID=2740835 RepID=A0A8X6LT91_TRICU|nr:hypothetical protein TNCT_131581 [Trichonephila clavata]